MRIIAGRFNRRVLISPEGNETRPTTDRTRESMFNLIVSRLDMDQIRVLDLFAGTGALGLESISRGAGHVDFVETSAIAGKAIRANIASLDPQISHHIHQEDAFRWLQKPLIRPYSLILADPPYHLDGISNLPEWALPKLEEDGLFVLEHDRRIGFSDHEACIVSRTYGKSSISIFSPPSK